MMTMAETMKNPETSNDNMLGRKFKLNKINAISGVPECQFMEK